MSLWPYLGGGVILWYCVYHAGIHASIAGVMLAFAIPFSPRRPTAESPSHRLERRLHKPVAYLILPLFALANTGVTIDAQAIARVDVMPIAQASRLDCSSASRSASSLMCLWR